MSTKIEWTDETWNPVRGCSRVSEGCRNCYAEKVAVRFSGEGMPYNGFATAIAPRDSLDRIGGRRSGWTRRVELIESKLDEPLHWKKPRRVFVNSMSDLFHEGLSNEQIASVFGVMAACREHTFQVLTKRPERMRAWFEWIASTWPRMFPNIVPDIIEANVVLQFLPNEDRFQIEGKTYGDGDPGEWPLSNVWLGVSVENQAAADERIPLLLQTPAAVRFLSCEPLLGPIDLTRFSPVVTTCGHTGADSAHALHDLARAVIRKSGGGMIDWVIAGGESGPGARPMHPGWARSLRDQCVAANVPFFFKQWGEHLPVLTDFEHSCGRCETIWPDGKVGAGSWGQNGGGGYNTCRVGKKRAGRELDGRTWDEFPAGVA